jgi:hypothetical protein
MTFTHNDLRDLGFRVEGSKAVRIAGGSAQMKRAQVRGRLEGPVSVSERDTTCEASAAVLRSPYKSKTEALYAQRLYALTTAGEFRGWEYEPVRLRIGVDAWYTPDFRVVRRDGVVELHEVKGGFIREAARVRLHSAAFQYHEYRFMLAQYRKGQWTITPIAATALQPPPRTGER